MNKSKFTIYQILFLIFSLIISPSVFAVGGDEDGLSCETAVNIVVDEPFEYTFEEGQEEMYLTLNSDSNALFLSIVEDNFIVNISEIRVYEQLDCSSLNLVYNKVIGSDSIDIKYYGIDGLNKNSDYLFHLVRDPNVQGLPNVTFSILMQDPIITPCPPSYNSNCSGFTELVPNGGFNYFSWFHSSWLNNTFYNLFHFGYICDWRDGGGSPDLVFKYDKTYAHMWSQGINYESIVTDSNFNIGAGDYMFSVDLAANHNSSVGIPDGMRLILKNSITQAKTTVVDIPSSQLQRTTPNSMNFKLSTACFNITQNYDRLIFRPYNNIGNNIQSQIYLDNLSIVPVNASFNAGPDIVLDACDSSVIGPSCVLQGATYSWSPTTGLSDPNIANPTISATQSGIYTLTMTTACTTLTDQINVNSSYDDIIPDGQTSTWLQSIHGSSNDPNEIIGKKFLVQGEFIINSLIEINWCEFIMAEGAKITISGGGELDIHGGNSAQRAIIRSCQPDKFWDGIYVSGSGGGHADFRGNTVIRNSINGIVFEDGSFSKVANVKFVNNLTAVTFKNYSTMYYKQYGMNIMPLTIISCEFSVNSHFADEFGYLPTHAVKVINFHLDPNNSFMQPLLVKWNTFDGTGGGLYIEDSDVKVHNNSFNGFSQGPSNFPGNPNRSDLAIRVKGSQTPGGSRNIDVYSNTFNSCYFGIETEDNFFYKIRSNTFNGSLALLSETGPGTSFLKMVENYSDADPNTSQNHIESNTIRDVEKGIRLETVREFNILDNTIDMEVQSLPSSYTQRTNKNSRAIYVNNFDIPLTINDLNIPRYISRNRIKHSKVGIQSSFVSSLTISENEIFNSNDNMSSTCPPPFTCSPLDPFGIRVVGHPSLIEENEVSNELSLYTNNQPYLSSNDQMVGISMENTAVVATMFIPGLYCNKIENTGIGMRFLGSSLASTQVVHNTLENHYHGFVLKNNGFIGDVGVDGDASDNEWNGAYTGSETLADNSDGSYCTLFVQNGGVYDPPINPIDRLNGGVIVQKDNSGNTPVSLSCSIPINTFQDNTKPKQPRQNVSKSGGNPLNWGQQIKKGKMPYMIHASDSALMLDRQLLYYHLSKDTALLNDKKWKTFADSMKLTPMGRSMKQSQNSRGAVNNFEANLISIDSIATKIENMDTLSQSDSMELRRVADLCPFYDGIAVYKARYLLHKLNLTVVLNDCERTIVNTSQKYIRLKNPIKDTNNVLFHIYPNPSQEWVTVEYTVEDNQEIFFELYDVVGKRHYQKQMSKGNVNRFNLEEMHQGMYFYRLVNDENILESGKLLIQK